MYRKTAIALLGAIVIALAGTAAAVAAGSGPAVTVKIRTLTKTLRTAVVHGQTGWITKGGTPTGTCSRNSGAGALAAATHGKWAGHYYASLKDIFVTSVLGVKPKSPDYWGVFVNGKSSSVGLCHVKLRAHETILLKIVK
ncbi:MAG TPA: DUF4430 domain-containing protein [Solirubrobacteraceae bacterium]